MSDNVVVGSFFRRPLGVFTAVLVVGLVVIAAAMSAFGGTSGGSYQVAGPLSPAQFRRASVRICLSFRSLDKAIIANGKVRNLREATRFFHKFTPRFDHLTADVDGLVPPASAAASFRRLRTNLDAANRALDRLDHLAETHQWRRFVLFARSRSYKNTFKRLGPPTKLRDITCGQASHTAA